MLAKHVMEHNVTKTSFQLLNPLLMTSKRGNSSVAPASRLACRKSVEDLGGADSPARVPARQFYRLASLRPQRHRTLLTTVGADVMWSRRRIPFPGGRSDSVVVVVVARATCVRRKASGVRLKDVRGRAEAEIASGRDGRRQRERRENSIIQVAENCISRPHARRLCLSHVEARTSSRRQPSQSSQPASVRRGSAAAMAVRGRDAESGNHC